MDEFNRLLAKTRAFEMSNWVKDKPFLSLNPTEKSEILAFVCNELLTHKGVVFQIDSTVDKVNHAKKIKIAVDHKLKRLKSIQMRKFKTTSKPEVDEQSASHIEDSVSEFTSTAGDADKEDTRDDTMSVVSETTTEVTPKKVKGKRGRKPKNKPKEEQPEQEPQENDDHSDVDLAELEEEDGEDDEKLSAEDLQKKIEKTVKQFAKAKEDLVFTNNCLRVNDLGQDRYRRRYWHFAHAGGVLVEAVESTEPWKLECKGMPHEEKTRKIEEEEEEEEEEVKKECKEMPQEDKKRKMEDDEEEPENKKVKKEEKENVEFKPINDVMVTPKMEEKPKSDLLKNLVSPKTTPNGDKLNLFNHSAQFNMALSPVVLNGVVTITPKSGFESGFSTSSPISHQINNNDRPWFSLLPMGKIPSVDRSAKFDKMKRESLNDNGNLPSNYPVNPQIAMLEMRLEQLKKSNVRHERRPIPEDFLRGWWHITDPTDILSIERSLNIRGTREQILGHNLRRNMDVCKQQQHTDLKPLAEEITLEINEEMSQVPELLPCGAPPSDDSGSWSREAALRVDKYVLEQVEALEDKVASASMQVPGWKVPNLGDIETRPFRPSCEPPSGPDDTRVDPIAEARERLLDLEQAIERRYLKAPLGSSNTEVSLHTITSSTTSSRATSGQTTPRRTTNTSLNIIKEHQNGNNEEDSNPETENGNEEEEEQENDEEEQEEDNENSKNLPKGLVTWRAGVRQAKTAAQLAMGFYVLETAIAWHKSIMKAFCQLCHSGDDEDSLLLCDGCDKGYHMYCFKPSMTTVPEGDWYCFECINKASGVRHCLVCGKLDGKHLVPCTSCPRAYHTDCLSPALGKVPRGKWQCPGCNQKGPKKRIPKKLKILVGSPVITEDSNSQNSNTSVKEAKKSPQPQSPESEDQEEEEKEECEKRGKRKKEDADSDKGEAKKAKKEYKKKGKAEKDLTPCMILIEELESCDDSWPFLFPVNTKQFPTYKKIIKNPMDVATIKKRLENGVYKNREEFCNDVKLIFANCEIFNEDNSPVGKAGHAMKQLFDTRWVELIGQEASK